MTTISNNSTIGVNLQTAFYISPVIIAPNVNISNPNYPNAVYTDPGSKATFVVENRGTIVGAGSGAGVYLSPGGAVENVNPGTIVAPGSVVGYGLIKGNIGVEITGGSGVVVNEGRIIGTNHGGVDLQSGGTIVNAAGAFILSQGRYAYAVQVNGATGTVLNYGQISQDINLTAGGTVVNNLDGLIAGANISGGSGTVVNDGSSSSAIVLNSGGSINNEVAGLLAIAQNGIVGYGAVNILNSGTIDNARSIVIRAAAATVVNVGEIIASTYGVRLDSGGLVTNAATGSIVLTAGGFSPSGAVGIYGAVGTVLNAGLISGASYGVDLRVGGTVINSGTIIATGGPAVEFGGSYTNLLVLDPGAAFSGVVEGSASATNKLELAPGASAGTLTGLGQEFLDFKSIFFNAGAQWSIAGVTRGLAGVINGFSPGDTIELSGITATGSSYADGILTLSEAVGSATLDLPGPFTTADFVVTNSAGGASVSLLPGTVGAVPCFRSGTRVATPCGEVAVEALKVGDPVLAHQGDGRIAPWPVVWIGHRTVDCRRHPQPQKVWPVRIAPGAFGGGLPRQALFLSPDHAVFIADVLIPIRTLINGENVAQVAVTEVTYFHVELAHHSVLMAEGLPCESYLDTSNRSAFANHAGAVQLHADFNCHEHGEAMWEIAACAPLRVAGPTIEHVAAGLRWQAKNPGCPRPRGTRPKPRATPDTSTTDLSALLWPEWYLATNPDVAASGMEPVAHYANFGRTEGRLPCPAIDLVRGLGLVDSGILMFSMDDVIAAGVDPVEHFCTTGWHERRRPNAYFETGWYLDTHAVALGTNPLLHYILWGEAAGLAPSRHFDPVWYRQYYAIGAMDSPLAHYLKHRRTQRFSPHPSFNVLNYVKKHTSTLPPDRDPYAHFLAFGRYVESRAQGSAA